MTNIHINLGNHPTQRRRDNPVKNYGQKDIIKEYPTKMVLEKKAKKIVWNGAISKYLLTYIVLGQTLFNPNNIDLM